jgi:hypothetical protein
VAGHQIDEHYGAACGFDHIAADDLLARVIGALEHRRVVAILFTYFAKPK